jgi:hypothetical protein
MSPSDEDISGVDAAIQLLRLKQTGSARDYSIEFLRLWEKATNETYLAAELFLGLKEEIQAGIYELGALPGTWEAIGERAQIVEKKLYSMRN